MAWYEKKGYLLPEKRKFVRLHASIGVAYRLVKKFKPQRETLSLVKNIGGGGILIQANQDLRSGDILKLEIRVPHLTDAIKAVGEVVWFTDMKEQDRKSREAGIRFRDIDEKDLHRILEYVHVIGIG